VLWLRQLLIGQPNSAATHNRPFLAQNAKLG